jgi:hypothetical protein
MLQALAQSFSWETTDPSSAYLLDGRNDCWLGLEIPRTLLVIADKVIE